MNLLIFYQILKMILLFFNDFLIRLIRQLFLKFNSSTPSSTPVERLFSGAAQILTPRRNRLSVEHIDMMLLLKIMISFSGGA